MQSVYRNILSFKSLRYYCSIVKNTNAAITSKNLDFNNIKHKSKVPLKPCITSDTAKSQAKFQISKETLELLEKLSLVNLSDK